jgi:hypothetical protein
MKKFARALLSAGIVAATVFATEAAATNYTLWIHGRGGGGVIGNHNSWNYWGPSTTAAGVNKKSVNWDGRSRIADSNGHIRNALDCYCTGSNWCYIAVHSAGDLQIGYALSLHGGSSRYKKNAVPNSSGVCGNTDGTTQVGWNIKWVNVASGASGGSELSDNGDWTTSEPLVSDLRTTTARAMYDHNQTRAKWFYNFAGAKGTLYSGILPGQDDEAVAYHTTGGVSGSAGGAWCNPSDWLCNDLALGTAANEGGRAKWGYHSVKFRDDNESYSHSGEGNWAGIVSVVRADVVKYAL